MSSAPKLIAVTKTLTKAQQKKADLLLNTNKTPEQVRRANAAIGLQDISR